MRLAMWSTGGTTTCFGPWPQQGVRTSTTSFAPFAVKAFRAAQTQVQVDHFVGHRTRIFEYHRANRRLAAPVPRLLAALARDAEGIHRVGPGWIGPVALVERGKSVAVHSG